MALKKARPRVLATGFSVFPGAPVNPTERLVKHWHRHPPAVAGMAAFRADVLAVEYDGMADRLSALGRDFRPDIVVHFGLAHGARGFRLERVARNSLAGARPDNAGRMPAAERICEGADTFVSTLPLPAVAARLAEADLPLEWSEDAGGYLCNMVFALTASGTCRDVAPVMAGFVHVPPLAEKGSGMHFDDLVAGAEIILSACCDAWRG